MARTRKQDAQQRPYIMPNTETKPLTSLRGIPPQNQAAAQVMADPTKREYAGKLLGALTDSFKMRPVQSNAELAARIEDFFRFIAERQVLPTLEGLALYCGYSRATMQDWRTGRNRGFSDRYFGLTTSDIVEKANTLLQAFDADMAMNGRVTPVSYIFRAKANWAYQDAVTLEVVDGANGLRPALTAEEIAKNLPDPDDDLLNIE